MSPYIPKIWTLGGCLADHATVFSSLPRIAGAYAGPNAIDPDLNESVMVTVNSVNQCPYCEGLHGQLARMAGVEGQAQLMHAATEQECRAVVDDPAISFARVFAENNGRGEAVEAAFAQLADQKGAGRASSVQALCWFLLWGSLGGNTVNALLARFRGQAKPGSSLLFELLFFVYYGPLFLVIAVLNAILKLAPRVPRWTSAGIGLTLTVVAGLWMILPGVLGLLARPRPRILAACPA
ncbi:MAG: carboxymuconolactone decarboxylase family protein [Planctomycetes bacterium]|jgi:AhpD family alkylhydroperoxidase|nr:carboxymuconolactone decarboxylase family protein [Planctomycetota bacterium]